MKNRLLPIGIAGTIVSALCCFTPILIWVLPAIGLASVLASLDVVLLPALFVFLVITAIGLWRWQAAR